MYKNINLKQIQTLWRKKMIKIETANGIIAYSENALANIIGINILEMPGVKGLAAKNAVDGLWGLLQRDNYTKGIELQDENNELLISIAIVASYGTKISEVAKSIMTTIKYNIENLTDIPVKSITVTVQQVVLD